MRTIMIVFTMITSCSLTTKKSEEEKKVLAKAKMDLVCPDSSVVKTFPFMNFKLELGTSPEIVLISKFKSNFKEHEIKFSKGENALEYEYELFWGESSVRYFRQNEFSYLKEFSISENDLKYLNNVSSLLNYLECLRRESREEVTVYGTEEEFYISCVIKKEGAGFRLKNYIYD